jgi:hypothetical protein
MPFLQPYHVFIAETTRLNELYWTSKYAYTRVSAILKAISNTGKSDQDPRVDSLWSSIDEGETKHIARSLSGFTQQLETNSASLRITSILHICSAFETAISNYFALCALYLPRNVDSTYTGYGVPEILRNESDYTNLKNRAIDQASKKLRGLYTKRLELIITTFNLPILTTSAINRLDNHYHNRHFIAHDQSLAAADAPDLSVKEILQSQIAIEENEWKELIKDFHDTLFELDDAIQQNVVKDKALSIAINHIITREGSMRLSNLKFKLSDEWRTGTFPTLIVKNAIANLGMRTEQKFDGGWWVSLS